MAFTLSDFAFMAAASASGDRLGRVPDVGFEALYALDQECFPRGIAYSRRTLRWFLRQPGAECVVAHADGTPADSANNLAGFIVAETQGREGHIVTLDVAVQYRRAGVGRALLRAVEDRMAARGVQQVALETATSNDVAVAFWQRHGYRSVGVLTGYYSRNVDAFYMLKKLPISK